MAELMNSFSSLEFNFVCFLDILGFSHMVKSDCEAPRGNERFIKKLFRVHSDTIKLKDPHLELDVNQFSDSVVLSSPYKRAKFPNFLKIISKYQFDLFCESILC